MVRLESLGEGAPHPRCALGALGSSGRSGPRSLPGYQALHLLVRHLLHQFRENLSFHLGFFLFCREGLFFLFEGGENFATGCSSAILAFVAKERAIKVVAAQEGVIARAAVREWDDSLTPHLRALPGRFP